MKTQVDKFKSEAQVLEKKNFETEQRLMKIKINLKEISIE